MPPRRGLLAREKPFEAERTDRRECPTKIPGVDALRTAETYPPLRALG